MLSKFKTTMFSFHCPHCQQKFSADSDRSGETLKYHECGVDFAIPTVKSRSAPPSSTKPTLQANNDGSKTERSKLSPRFVLLGIGILAICAFGLGRLSVLPGSGTRKTTGKSLDPNSESVATVYDSAVIPDTTKEEVKIREKIDENVSGVPKDTPRSESLGLVSPLESPKLTESWEHQSLRLDAVVSCSLPKGSFSVSYNDIDYTINIDFTNYPGAQTKTGSLSISVGGLSKKFHVREDFKSRESFKEYWIQTYEKQMIGMPDGKLGEYKNNFQKYRFDPVESNDFKGFVWGREDENIPNIFLTTGKNFVRGRLKDYDGGPMTLELALKIISSVSVLHPPDLSIASLSAESLNPPSDLLLIPDESALPAETKESRNNEEQNNSTGESAATAVTMAPDNTLASPTSTAMQMAESDPEAFLKMLRQRVLDDLIKESDRESCASIGKYENFVASIPEDKTRFDAQAMLKDLKENYSKTWHLLYPIPLSERWHEIKGNPVAKRDFAEILGLAGVRACEREEVLEAMEPVSGLNIFGPVNYLDPLEEAVLKLSDAADGYKFKSTKAKSFDRVESAGFPLNTFYSYSFDVESPQDSVNRIFFMVDQYKRVVAFQEVIESPKQVRLSMHNNTRSVFNFIQMRRKGTGTYEIAYINTYSSGTVSSFNRFSFGQMTSSNNGNVCVLTSELIDAKRKPREWVRLHLPRRLAEVCLFICEEIDD